MTLCIKLPVCGYAVCIQGQNDLEVACHVRAAGPGHPKVESGPNTNSAQSRLEVITRERDELRCMLNEVQLAAGQKRKETSEVSTKTLDPRKKKRMSPPEEERRAKIVDQDRHITELEGRLSKTREESKAKRNSDELELSNVRTHASILSLSCLKDLIDKADANQQLIRKLESDVERKEEAIKTASATLDAKMKEIATARNTISHLEERVRYLEHDRKCLKADVRRYHSNAYDIYTHYKSKMDRQRREGMYRMHKRQSLNSYSSAATGQLQPLLPSSSGLELDIESSKIGVNERCSRTRIPQSLQVDGR
ncbi:hypothetical protein C8R44DRAFT_847631 [Mycena epipterygia]|nr:hypothetical protein C8R44DRAFT_847631 [Mycena epipterygia]